MESYYKIIILIIVCIVIGAVIGYMLGVYTTVNTVAKIAKNFIDIDEDLVYRAIFQYENNIGACFGNISV